jgi:hypothetical protein
VTAGEGFDAERAGPADSTPIAGTAPPEETPRASADRTPAHDRIAALEEIAARPLAEHPDGYERVHAELRSALAEIDDA